MSETVLRLSPKVRIEPCHADNHLDCRLLFIGDRNRQLVRAYGEAVFRLSQDRSIDGLEAYVRDSAEIRQFYEVSREGQRISLCLHDAMFREPASANDLDVWLEATDGEKPHRTKLPLELLRAAGTLMSLLNGDYAEGALLQELRSRLRQDEAHWAEELLRVYDSLGYIDRGPASPNVFRNEGGKPRATFMGHSSVLFQSAQTSVVVDPLYRVSLGVPPFTFDAARLPLGAIFCSHSHWDHCDVATLLRFDKRTPIVVPRVHKPTIFNPPIIPLLSLMGFTDIREIDPWETMRIGDIDVAAVPFHGEQDEPGAEIDHYTYVLTSNGFSVYGGVDAFRDTFGDMLPHLARVKSDWAPQVAFLPVSRMTYAWRFGGVNGYCRYVDTDLLSQSFQYTAGAEHALEWARTLGVKKVVPYATFNFSRLGVPSQAVEFRRVLQENGLSDLLLPLRPFDAVGPADLNADFSARARRQYLMAITGADATVAHLDRELSKRTPYRLAKRALKLRTPASEHHHH